MLKKMNTQLKDIVATYQDYVKVVKELEESQELLSYPDMKEIAEEEIQDLSEQLGEILQGDM